MSDSLMARYQLLSEIGRGMMGVVMRARDGVTHREVAIKLISAQMSGDADILARFRTEAVALASLDHPGIVKVFDAGILDGKPFLAMELLAGQDLYTVHRAREVALPELLDWIRQAADALAYVHAKGMVHRDVKPSNLMLEPGGRLVITDFGLVRVPGQAGLTAPGTTVGTPRYIAPEALTGNERAGPPADVYALAITLLELHSGRSWCGALEEDALLHRIAHGPGPDLRAARPDAPDWLVTLIAHATHRDPGARPTAEEVSGRLIARKGEDRTQALAPAGGAELLPQPAARVDPPAPARGSMKGRYRLVEKIGAGGMGIVYRAEQIDLQREVALKCILPQTDPGPQFVERFRREALALSRVSNPGLVKVFDVSEEGAEPYIAMELVRGRTLEAAVGAEPVQVRRDADRIFLAILEAVAALHDKGLVHRDLKPANIMLTPEGRPVVMDLGLVKDFHGNWTGLTATGAVIGTPTYLAPEVLVEGEVKTSADVWALGAVYFYLQTGRPPFWDATLEGLFKLITTAPMPDFAAECPDLTEQSRAFLARLLERDPAKRPRDARRALELFRRARSGGAITPVSRQRPLPLPVTSPSVRTGGRRLAAVAVGLAVALVAAVGVARRGAGRAAGEGVPSPPSPAASVVAAARLDDGPVHTATRAQFLRWKEIEGGLPRLKGPGARPFARWLHQQGTLPLGGDPRSWIFWVELGRWLEDPRRPLRAAAAPPLDAASSLVEQQIYFPRVWRADHTSPAVVGATVWSLEMSPGQPCGWLVLGYILEQEGKPEQALPCFRRGLRLMEEAPVIPSAAEIVYRGLGRALARVPGRSLSEWMRLQANPRPSWRATEGLRRGWDLPDRAKLRSLLLELSKTPGNAEALFAAGNDVEQWDMDPARAREVWADPLGNEGPNVIMSRHHVFYRRGRFAEARRFGDLWWTRGIEDERPRLDVAPGREVGTRTGDAPASYAYSIAVEARELKRALELGTHLAEAGEIPTVEFWADMIRAGDRSPRLVSAARALATTGAPCWDDLAILSGALSAPLDATWYFDALEARIARPGAPACPSVALALWHSRSRRHAEALDALEPVRAHPHVARHHAPELLEVLGRPLMDRMAGRAVDPAALARLPGPEAPPAALHATSAPLWSALAKGDARGTLERARAAIDVLPFAPVHWLALAHAAAALPDARAAGLAQARAAARFNHSPLWLRDVLRELAGKR